SPAQWRNGVQNEAELDEVPSISASEFLKMTRISFMDGLTVKRRSTIGLGVLGRRRSEGQPPAGVADYIVAMTVGVPQLETFNYAAKELKEYISNGKKAIRILEDDLDANNPYLFKEYLASGEEDRRAIEETLGGHKEAMRMRSKMSWYKWRHGFVLEMQAAADQEAEQLQQDLESLRGVANQISNPVPSLREQHAKLKAQLAAERAAVEAVKDCDPEAMEELKAGIAEQNTQIESYKADTMLRQTTTLNLKKVVRMLGRLWASISHLRCNLRLLAMKYPVTITRASNGFGFKATTCLRFPRLSGLAKITFTAGEQQIREWGRQLHTMGAEVDIVYGSLDRDLILDVVKERISEAVIEESYGLMLDACADAVACVEE
ncbi:hypothetical protein FRC12_016008, partial [Ceratobasidium sp. 428]